MARSPRAGSEIRARASVAGGSDTETALCGFSTEAAQRQAKPWKSSKRSNFADALQSLAGLSAGSPAQSNSRQHRPSKPRTGNQIKLSYSRGERPIYEVRLQEVFGWTVTPRVVGGRVPILLHLLAPNYRPVQITDDLASFWSNTYFRVPQGSEGRIPETRLAR